MNWYGETGTLCTAVGVENGAATMENGKVIPQKKIKNRMIPFWIQTPKNWKQELKQIFIM